MEYNHTTIAVQKIQILVVILITLFLFSCASTQPLSETIPKPSTSVQIIESSFLDSVWVANKVSFALHTVGNQQYAAYYDKNRMMTVAMRDVNSQTWHKKTLTNQLKWDSHNYVAMGIDEKGFIHVSGNMHVNPLVYFRSAKPYDINSLTEVNVMTGIEESDVTYPKFFYDGKGQLYFSYRSGTCGNGNILINHFDAESESWKRYLNMPLFEGIEIDDDRAAYHKFVKDSEGNFHFIWMWRWTPEVATSHQICYATSSDLIHWKNAAGEEILLPFKPDNKKLIVDPSPSEGGMHNGRYQIILTSEDQPIVGYLKYDKAGLTQLYLARFEGNEWVREKISDWDFRWQFFGGGDKMSKGATFKLEGFSEAGSLIISWSTETGESGVYVIDPVTMKHVPFSLMETQLHHKSINDKITDNPQLSIAFQNDSGLATTENENYLLKWETKGKSHGRHAPAIIPKGPVSPLVVLKTRQTH